jgi:hypothetical protein
MSISTGERPQGIARRFTTRATVDGKDEWKAAQSNSASRDTLVPLPGRQLTTSAYHQRGPATIEKDRNPYLREQKPWQSVFGGKLQNGELAIGWNQSEPPITAAEAAAVYAGVIDAQQRAGKTAELVKGVWTPPMIKAGSEVFGFSPQGPSPAQKADLFRTYHALAAGLLGPVTVKLCGKKEILNADGLVMNYGNWRGNVHLAREFIGAPNNALDISMTMLHEFSHVLGAEDFWYLNHQMLLNNRWVAYSIGQPSKGVPDPTKNADSIGAFPFLIA